MNHRYLSRRTLITSATLVTSVSLMGPPARATGPADVAPLGAWEGNRSQNGWPILTTPPQSVDVEGTGYRVSLATPAAQTVLVYLARRYYYEVSPENPTGKVLSHSKDRRVRVSYESNRLSGTAVVIGAGLYPLGSTERIAEDDAIVIRDILAECEGTVVWGRDFQPPMDSYFGIGVAPNDPLLAKIARKITTGSDPDTVAAGYPVEVSARKRRLASHHLRSRQVKLRQVDVQRRRFVSGSAEAP